MTMYYSRFRPDSGGYDYFTAEERRGLGDDMPIPKLPRGTAIGVASTDIGRTPSGPLRPAGSGPVARGSILPVSRAGLSGTFDVISMLPAWVTWVALGGLAGVVLWEVQRGKR